jgi:hypothetical protein
MTAKILTLLFLWTAMGPVMACQALDLLPSPKYQGEKRFGVEVWTLNSVIFYVLAGPGMWAMAVYLIHKGRKAGVE